MVVAGAADLLNFAPCPVCGYGADARDWRQPSCAECGFHCPPRSVILRGWPDPRIRHTASRTIWLIVLAIVLLGAGSRIGTIRSAIAGAAGVVAIGALGLRELCLGAARRKRCDRAVIIQTDGILPIRRGRRPAAVDSWPAVSCMRIGVMGDGLYELLFTWVDRRRLPTVMYFEAEESAVRAVIAILNGHIEETDAARRGVKWSEYEQVAVDEYRHYRRRAVLWLMAFLLPVVAVVASIVWALL